MNTIRERVLTDKGFSSTPAKSEEHEQTIAALKGKIERLVTKLNGADAYNQKKRDLEVVNLKDQVKNFKNEIHALKKDNDKLSILASKVDTMKKVEKKLQGTIDQLQKEVKDNEAF